MLTQVKVVLCTLGTATLRVLVLYWKIWAAELGR
jgi:hypothetical protein